MGKIAFIFSGQGAQYSGMGKELYEASPAAKAVYDMADSVREGTSKQCFEGSTEELCKTVNTQPCVFTADLAAAYALVEKGIKPHSPFQKCFLMRKPLSWYAKGASLWTKPQRKIPAQWRLL